MDVARRVVIRVVVRDEKEVGGKVLGMNSAVNYSPDHLH
jgi:hypothetical protein